MTTYLLGVQLETNSMRLAIVRRANSGKSTHLRTDTLAFQPENSVARLAVFKDWIKEHIPSNSAVQAVLSVPESHIILKELELPVLKAAELAEAVHWELTDKSSIGIESTSTWQVIEKKTDVLRVATMVMKKSEVTDAIAFFSDAGVELTAIEPSSISVGRALSIPQKTSVLLTLDGSDVSAVFVRSGVPVFSTTFTIPLTEAAIRAKHFSREAAASLVSQLKRVISYWDAKESPVERIIVTSEASQYSGLKSDVARGFKIPLDVGRVDAAVVGAAMRTESEVNFLPKENRMRLEKKAFSDFARMRLWQFAKINILVLILLAALSGILWIRQITLAKNILQTKRFIENHPAQKYVSHITSVNALAQEISTLMAAQEDIGTRLRYLSSVTPPKLHFTSLKMVGGNRQEWLISGTGDRADILAFYYKLKTDGRLRDVTMPYSNFNSETGSLFTVTIVW